MATLNIADKPTLDSVDSDVTYIKNNLPSGSSSPILVIKNTNSEYTGVSFTVSGGDFTQTITMPDASNVEVTVPYVGEYMVSCDDGNWMVQVLGNGKTLTEPDIELEIVSFSTGTDEQIKKMLDAYYADQITWTEMGWNIGDTRTISLASMTPPNGSDASTWAAQNITVVIVDHDHTELATPINGHTKACITVHFRECMNNITTDSANRKTNGIYVNGDSSYDMTFTKWSDLYMRTYLNNTVWGAFPSTLKAAIKPSSHYRHTSYNTTASEQVTDNLFLPSYPEIFGTASYQYYTATSPTEGTQFSYYATSSNRIKYGNNNGASNGTAVYWWEGSASSNYNSSYGYYWCGVHTDGTAHYGIGIVANGLAPAFAM